MRIKANPAPPMPSIDTRSIIKQKKLAEDAAEFVKKFSDEFYNTFGVYPIVNYSFDNLPYLISLNQLIEVLNDLILEDEEISNKLTVKNRTRKREIVMYRQCGFVVATRMNYGPSRIAEAFGFDHATVIHANRVINELIETRDKHTLIILNRIQNELKKRFGTDGNVQPHDRSGTNSEPVLSDI